MKRKQKRYNPETKGKAVAALLTGQSITQVAESYHLPRSTVGRWSGELNRNANGTNRYIKNERIGELLLLFVVRSLETINAQLVVVSDKEWIYKQRADHLAILIGVLFDKTFRILEAMWRSEDREKRENRL